MKNITYICLNWYFKFTSFHFCHVMRARQVSRARSMVQQVKRARFIAQPLLRQKANRTRQIGLFGLHSPEKFSEEEQKISMQQPKEKTRWGHTG